MKSLKPRIKPNIKFWVKKPAFLAVKPSSLVDVTSVTPSRSLGFSLKKFDIFHYQNYARLGSNEQGLIPLLLAVLGAVIALIIFVFLRVQSAN